VIATACGVSNAPPPAPLPVDLPQAVEQACSTYVASGDVFGWCVRGAVAAVPEAGDAVRACAAAGRWEQRCRSAWVEPRLTDASIATNVLIGVCGDAADCAFRVLDARPEGAVAAQVGRCRALAARYEVDCVRHAMQRWVASGPDASALQAACAIDFPDIDDAGRWLAWPVACAEVGSCCTEPAPVAGACRRAVAELRADPARCGAGPLGPG